MVGLLDSADAVFRSFERTPRNGSSQRTAPELAVAIRTVSAFARFAIYGASSLQRGQTDNELGDSFEKQLDEKLSEIRKDAAGNKIRSGLQEGINIIMKRSKELEAICTHIGNHRDTGSEDDDDANIDFAESKLDARIVLGESVRNGLERMLNGLVGHLQCYGGGHLLRLKLTGFHSLPGAEQRLSFDAYLSPRYTWKPPR